MDKDKEDKHLNSHRNTIEPKGKGKSRETQYDGIENEPSVMSRLQDSARMAGTALINNSAGSQDTSTGLDSKGMQSGSSAPPNGPGQYQNAQSDTARLVPSTTQSETFRQSQRQAPSSARAFSDFIETHQALPDVEGTRLNAQVHVSDSAGWSSSGADVAQASAADGSAVADLLSQPDDPVMMPTMEEQVETISTEDAAKLRAALFDGPSSGDLPWDHLLNFTPDFASLHNSTDESLSRRQEHLGTEDQDSAAGKWLQQWRGVLTGYTNEIWGDLGMLVEEAKKEVENDMVVSGDERTETPALSRLKMILAHIRSDQ